MSRTVASGDPDLQISRAGHDIAVNDVTNAPASAHSRTPPRLSVDSLRRSKCQRARISRAARALKRSGLLRSRRAMLSAMRRILLGTIGVLLSIVLASVAAGNTIHGRNLAPGGLRVSGNRLVDGRDAAIQLRGVNRSVTEYACIQGWGIFDGPSDAASVQAVASWRVNIVRVPLNENCWLGINGVNPAYSGAKYRNAIVAYVNLLHRYGMYAELSLMWGAPGIYGKNACDAAACFTSSMAPIAKVVPHQGLQRNPILGPQRSLRVRTFSTASS